MAALREVCELTYQTSLGGTRVVRVPNPRSNLGLTDLNSAAAHIRTAQPFDTSVGQLQDLLRAQRVSTQRTVLI
jgi:hypothetical protein